MATGDLVKLGTLYLNGSKKSRPLNPVASGGDLHQFVAGQPIEIRDTDANDDNKLYWREINDGGKRYLVSDRAIVNYVSWSDLNSLGLIAGKNVTIDGKLYKLRVMTGGAHRRDSQAGDGYTGGMLPNEWDRWIANEAGLSGLPIPAESDKDSKHTSDKVSTHNKFWNWYDMFSWSQETYSFNSSLRTVRGDETVLRFATYTAGSKPTVVGWRPVLEEIDLDGVVTPDNYSTAGNGGRKLVRLSNGWEVAVTKTNDQFNFHVDKKDGSGWNPLCYINSSAINANDIALVSKGTRVYAIYGNSTNSIRYQAIDVLTQSNVNLDLSPINVDVNQSALGNVSLAINPQGTELHAAWTSKRAVLANTFNVRYAKGTISQSDGSVSWDTAIQITDYNSMGIDHANPSITLNASGQPVILVDMKNQAPNYYIYALSPSISVHHGGTKPAVGWGSGIVYGPIASHAQSSPSAVVDKDGVIHVVWGGADSTTQNLRLRYSKSTDGGVSWLPTELLPNGVNTATSIKDAPSITVDKENTVAIVVNYSTDQYQIIYRVGVIGGDWSQSASFKGRNPSALFDPTFAGSFGLVGARPTPPTIYQGDGMVKYIGEYNTNQAPTITVNTPNNATIYENDTFLINGTAHEPDLGDIVNVWYQINSGAARAIATQINTGNPVEFSEQLTFKGGKLHLPNSNTLTGTLADGVAHKLKVWAEDNKGGKSPIAERTFYVVPNRAPSLTIDPFESLADLIDADRVAMSGDSHDLDGNDVIVRYRINNGINTEIYSGPAGRWSFDFPLSKLKDGENTIVVEVVDTYDFKSSRTVKLNKTANLTPLTQSVQRYTIVPPAGSAQGVLFWVKRDESQDVSIEISMTNGTEPENFVPMTLDSSGPDEIGTVEDFFKHRADAPAEKIAIKLSWTGDKPIHQIQGALTQ